MRAGFMKHVHLFKDCSMPGAYYEVTAENNMNKNRLAILKLIKAGLLSEQYVPDEGLDWNYIYVACYRQRIVNVVYQAIKDNNIAVPAEYMRLFQVEALRGINTDRCQTSWINKIFKSFEDKNIVYLPLKGSYIKYLYPRTEFRQMGDADIYIERGQYDLIKPVMEQLGFEFIEETYHEFVWDKKDKLNVELHKSITDPRYGMVSFFNGFRDNVMKNRTSGCRVDMNMTEHLFYSLMHLAKHYISGTVSIRNVIDIYILRNEDSIDKAYLDKCLKEVRLEKFYEAVCSALDEWFGGKDLSEGSERLLDMSLVVSDETSENRKYTFNMFKEQEGEKKISFGKKTGYVLRRIFLPLGSMKKIFPVLDKAPFLLPVFWIWRPIYRLFTDRKHVKRFVDVSLADPNSKVEGYRSEMERLGLESMIKEYDHEIK